MSAHTISATSAPKIGVGVSATFCTVMNDAPLIRPD
jgi:hypothetical protein